MIKISKFCVILFNKTPRMLLNSSMIWNYPLCFWFAVTISPLSQFNGKFFLLYIPMFVHNLSYYYIVHVLWQILLLHTLVFSRVGFLCAFPQFSFAKLYWIELKMCIYLSLPFCLLMCLETECGFVSMYKIR